MTFLDVPPCTFQIEALDVSTVGQSLFNVGGILLFGHFRVQSTLVERPVLVTASRLHKSSEIWLGNVEATKPYDFRFFNLVPILVLSVASFEVLYPGNKVFHCCWSECLPLGWHKTVEDLVGHFFKILWQSDLTNKCSSEVIQRLVHTFQQNVKSFDFLQQDNLGWTWLLKVLFDLL